jgi:hypothetical protein
LDDDYDADDADDADDDDDIWQVIYPGDRLPDSRMFKACNKSIL